MTKLTRAAFFARLAMLAGEFRIGDIPYKLPDMVTRAREENLPVPLGAKADDVIIAGILAAMDYRAHAAQTIAAFEFAWEHYESLSVS